MRPHRYALAIAGGSVAAGVLGLHGCDNPVCVKIAAATDVQQHVVSGSQGDNMERMRRGGGRHAVRRLDSRGVRSRVRWRCAMRCGTAGTPPRCRRRCLVISPRCGDPGAGGAALAGVAPETLGRQVRRPGGRCRSVELDGPGGVAERALQTRCRTPRRAAGAPLWRRTTRAARTRRLCGPSRCVADQLRITRWFTQRWGSGHSLVIGMLILAAAFTPMIAFPNVARGRGRCGHRPRRCSSGACGGLSGCVHLRDGHRRLARRQPIGRYALRLLQHHHRHRHFGGKLATGRRGQRTCLHVSRELACELIAIGAELSAERFACAKQLYDAQRVVEVRNERMPGTGMMSEAGVDAVEAESTRKSNLSWR